jgi:hypothetical protein
MAYRVAMCRYSRSLLVNRHSLSQPNFSANPGGQINYRYVTMVQLKPAGQLWAHPAPVPCKPADTDLRSKFMMTEGGAPTSRHFLLFAPLSIIWTVQWLDHGAFTCQTRATSAYPAPGIRVLCGRENAQERRSDCGASRLVLQRQL